MTITLYHRQPVGGFVTVATSRGAYTEEVPLAVARFILWVATSLWPQLVILGAWGVLEECATFYQVALEFRQVAVRLLLDWRQSVIEWLAEEVRLW